MIDSPSLAMASNVYRRLHGVWPEAVRFAPAHFEAFAEANPGTAITLLASVLEIGITSRERSPRLTVSGPHGAVTYDDGVEEVDWDQAAFHDWLREEASRRQIALPDGKGL